LRHELLVKGAGLEPGFSVAALRPSASDSSGSRDAAGWLISSWPVCERETVDSALRQVDFLDSVRHALVEACWSTVIWSPNTAMRTAERDLALQAQRAYERT
jgi:hypothetical protein